MDSASLIPFLVARSVRILTARSAFHISSAERNVSLKNPPKNPTFSLCPRTTSPATAREIELESLAPLNKSSKSLSCASLNVVNSTGTVPDGIEDALIATILYPATPNKSSVTSDAVVGSTLIYLGPEGVFIFAYVKDGLFLTPRLLFKAPTNLIKSGSENHDLFLAPANLSKSAERPALSLGTVKGGEPVAGKILFV